MKITFLGTRGNIDAKTRRHFRHTSTLIFYRGQKEFPPLILHDIISEFFEIGSCDGSKKK